MDENTERTPHPEEPAEGGTDAGGSEFDDERPQGDPAVIPQHNSAPDGYAPAESGTDAAADARDGTPATDADADARSYADDASAGAASADGMGGAIQGDSPLEESTGGAIQGDAGPLRDAQLGGEAHLGGDATTEQQLDADNEVEEDTLKTLDPDDPPA